MTEYCHRLMNHAAGVASAGPFALPGSTPQYGPDRDFATRHVRLELRVDLRRRTVRGKCTTTLQAIHDQSRSVVFDASQMTVAKVTAAGRPCRFEHQAAKLTIALNDRCRAGQTMDVVIAYRLEQPSVGLHFIGRRKDSKLASQVWTQGQDEDSRCWFPCHDAPNTKATTEMLIDVPAGFYALSNGKLLAKRRGRDSRRVTFHWAMTLPHSMYLVMLAVGRWVEIRDTWNRVPVSYLVGKGREAMARLAFGKTPKMLDVFSDLTGCKYPYEKYSQVAVADFPFGGMENTTATTHTEHVLCDERAVAEHWHENLVAHELAHHWFGNLLTCKDWSQAWLNEGFATYFDAVFTEREHGPDAFRYQMLQNARMYLREARERYRRPLVTNKYKQPWDLFDGHLYGKGACILHMLRYLLGEQLWWRAIRTYVRENAGACVETIDWVNAIESATGRNLRWFFDQWIFREGHPDYRVAFSWERKTSEAVIWVAQKQSPGDDTQLFRMPVRFEFTMPDRSTRTFRETVKDREHTFHFRLPREPVLFRFDPGSWILKTLDETKPREMWLAQLENDPDSLGRAAAAEALAIIGSASVVEALRNALLKETFWGAQNEIAKALSSIGTDDAYRALLDGLSARDPRARRAVVEALGAFPREDTVRHLKGALAAKDSYQVPCEALRVIGKCRTPDASSILLKHLEVESWNESIRSAAIDGLAALNDESHLPAITKYLDPGYGFAVRAAAVRAIAKLTRGRSDAVPLLAPLLASPNLLVRLTAVVELGRLGDPKAIPLLAALAECDASRRFIRVIDDSIRQIRAGIDLAPSTTQQRPNRRKAARPPKARAWQVDTTPP
jgi:aminopeptidase N